MQARPRIETAVQQYRQAFSSPWRGFHVNRYEFAPLEIPDHWFPHHVVAVDICPKALNRFWHENGREQRAVVHTGFVSLQYPGELRRFRWDVPVQTTAVTIPPDTISRIFPEAAHGRDIRLIGKIGFPDPEISALVMRLHADLAAGCPTGLIYGESLGTQLAAMLVERYSVERIRLPVYRGGLPKTRLARVLDHIESSLDRNLIVDEVAYIAGLSRYHFGKVFKQSTGTSLHHYILWRRIRRAQKLLRNRRLSLAEVSAAVGFSSQSHLTAVFAKTLGVTPGEYRRAVA